MDRERVDRDSQVFGVHLRKTLATGIVFEEFFEHGVVDHFRSSAVHFDDFFFFGIERVEGAEGEAAVAEQDEEILALRPCDFLEHPLLGLAIHHAGEDAILDRVQNDGTVGTSRRLLVQSRTDVILI